MISDYIVHIPEVLEVEPDYPLLVVSRVSTQAQYDNGNAQRQHMRTVKTLKAMGAMNIVNENEPIVEVASGGFSDLALEHIAVIAEGAMIVVESVDRLLRAEDYHPNKNPNALPTDKDFMRVKNILGLSTFVASVIHPDADFTEIRRYQKKMDLIVNKIGGRPIKLTRKQRRKKYRAKVLKMRKDGISHNQVSKQLSLPISLVRYWWLMHTKKRLKSAI